MNGLELPSPESGHLPIALLVVRGIHLSPRHNFGERVVDIPRVVGL